MAKNARALAADAMTARLMDELGAPDARAGLHYYAWTLGPDVCEQLLLGALALADADDSEAVWTADGRRRRMTGGIFFLLARQYSRRKLAA